MTMSAQEYPVVYDHATNYKRLIDAYGIAADRRGGWLDEMAGAFDHYPAEAVQRATDGYIRRVKAVPGAFVQVPPPGTFAEWVYQATDDLDAEADGRRTPSDGIALPPPAGGADNAARLKALPPPERPRPEPAALAIGEDRPPAGSTREGWEYGIARGKALQRNRITLIQRYRRGEGPAHDRNSEVAEEVWKGRIEPTEEQIQAVLAEMRVGARQSLETLHRRMRPGERRTHRVEWADGEVSEVEVSRGGDTRPLRERADDPRNKALLAKYDTTRPLNEAEYERSKEGR